MLTTVIKPFLEEYRKHPMARFALWMVAYGVALWLVERFTGGVPGLLLFIAWAALVASVVYYVVRLLRFVQHRLLWRLRRRLIVTYLFIAVVPIVLIVLLVLIKDFLSGGQFAAFLVALKLRGRANELQQLTRVVGHEAHQGRGTTPEEILARLEMFFHSELGQHSRSYPGLEITLRLGPKVRVFRLDGKPAGGPADVPAWLEREEFADFVVDHDQIALRAVNRGHTPAGDLTLVLTQPVTPELLDLVGQGIGPVGVLLPRAGAAVPSRPPPSSPPPGVGVLVPGAGAEARSPSPAAGRRLQVPEGEIPGSQSIRSKSVPIPPPANPLDSTVFGASTLEPVVWGGETEQHLQEPVFVFVTSRIGTLNRELLATLGRFSRIYVTVFIAVATLFLTIELFSLVIGVRLTRSITQTVDKLYDATERVKAGDFSFRINIPARDQLSALGKAFDSMTASVERLLRESQEKLRLESEIEIAREVQRQLFPQTVPEVAGLKLYGVCKPARSVSGDYYDFLRFGDDQVGLVLGDVSGKGISAALLMASIQSALRAQFYDGFRPAAGSRSLPISTSEAVGRLNRQLHENTPTEKYATFFYAVYDAGTRQLTYTNAGHLPPVLFRQGNLLRLKAGGTVVGLFPEARYDQAEVELQAGDVLLAFTDGLTEAENTYGEEFGEARLLDLARRALSLPPEVLAEEVFRGVSDWTGSPELQDDMTMLVAKAME